MVTINKTDITYLLYLIITLAQNIFAFNNFSISSTVNYEQ